MGREDGIFIKQTLDWNPMGFLEYHGIEILFHFTHISALFQFGCFYTVWRLTWSNIIVHLRFNKNQVVGILSGNTVDPIVKVLL